MVALGAVHVLPESGAARAVGWIRFAYAWLIAVVVGGMVVHNVLDLQRKAQRPPAPVVRPCLASGCRVRSVGSTAS
jgi:hypothetical protein